MERSAVVVEQLRELKNRQQEVIAQGCLTNSKHHSSFVEGPYPTHAKHAYGAKLFTTDGRSFIDTYAALGAISLGFCDGKVNEAAKEAMYNGQSLSLPSRYEVEAAELLLSTYLNFFDCVKYLKTGAEATSAAVRIARAATNRSQVLSVGYHGWHDLWISTKFNPKGLGDHEYDIFEFPSIKDLIESNSITQKTACVIVEPVMLEYSNQAIQELRQLKEVCEKRGAILVFDEIVCGMRLPTGFISKLVQPDITCFGKGVANGFSVAGLATTKKLGHETPYFVSSTYAGETGPLAAHRATIDEHRSRHSQFDGLWEMGQEMNEFHNQCIRNAQLDIELKGYPTRAFFVAKNMEHLSLWFQEVLKQGVFVGRSVFHYYAQIVHWPIYKTALENASEQIRLGARLQGQVVKEPFKRI